MINKCRYRHTRGPTNTLEVDYGSTMAALWIEVHSYGHRRSSTGVTIDPYG